MKEINHSKKLKKHAAPKQRYIENEFNFHPYLAYFGKDNCLTKVK